MGSSFLSQGVDYLGFLDAELRNLRGYTSLAHEFLQNADDAGAREVVFDFREDALVIKNDQLFSDCGHVVEERECPWKRDSAVGHRCDFHRFRLVAGRDKREDSDTIGAFGIGFISAYQITDSPEVISGNRHWIIRPENPEENRIEQRPYAKIPGTTFRLPWAFQQDSALRKALSLEHVTRDGINQFREDLARSLPTSVLFLRNIKMVDLWVEGRPRKRVQRSIEGYNLRVWDEQQNYVWQMLAGNFQTDASRIRLESANRVESKRKSDVTIAIPAIDRNAPSLLYAYLPTEHQTGLPFHINSDFFPSSDRKRVLLDTADYQQRWNEAAIRAAAKVFSINCLAVRDFLGGKAFWEALEKLEQVAREADDQKQNPAFGEFWSALKLCLPVLEVVKTADGTWKKPGEAYLLRSKDEEAAIPVLGKIGLPIVHPELRFAQNLLIQSEVGVRVLKLQDLATALRNAGLTERMPLESAPSWIQHVEDRGKLGEEIEALREGRIPLSEQEAVLKKLSECSIAVAENRELAPPIALRRASRETIHVFGPIESSSYFLAQDNPQGVMDLVSEFSPEDGLRIIERLSHEVLTTSWRGNPESFKRIIAWFADRCAAIRGDQALKSRLRKLAIWPSRGALHPLTELAIPGDFEDPLHLAKILDIDLLRGCRDFVIELGVRSLTLSNYAVSQVPQAVSSDKAVSHDVRRALLQLLATRMGEFTGVPESRARLGSCPLAECTDGVFRAPEDVYFNLPEVVDLLADDVPVVVVPSQHETAIRQFLKWLGVAERPRPNDLLTEVRYVIEGPANGERRSKIQRIFAYLGRLWSREEDQDEFGFRELKASSWLPVIGDGQSWYVPSQVYASYSRHLFETQGVFLDVSPFQQGLAREFIRYLGIGIDPTPAQVVNHLLECSNARSEVNRAVYTFLSQKADDRAILRLRDRPSLQLSGVGFVRPDKVFWGPHSFGRFRFQLTADHGEYRSLYERLGVRELPVAEDAIQVLLETSDEYGQRNQPLDDDGLQVVMHCWKLIEDGLSKGALDKSRLPALTTRKTVPDDRRILERPDQVFFDDRPGLAPKFQNLIQHNVIVRPVGAWHGMEAAGVKPLSRAVQSSLVECEDAADASDLAKRLQERRVLIARVIDAHRIDETRKSLELLDRLIFERASDLQVTYTLRAFNQVRTTQPEAVLVYYDSDQLTLYFRNDIPPPWAAIARELAFAVVPNLEPGAISSGLKEVLSAVSFEEASEILDELGYPGVEVRSTAGVTSAPVGLGGSAPPEPGEQGQPATTEPSYDASITTSQAALLALGIGTSPEPLPPGLDKPEIILRGAGRNSRTSRGSQLRTYVAPQCEGNNSEMDEEEKQRRSSLAKAGVRRVLEYEHSSGRNPIEMPVNYPGYDIESQDGDGTVVRFIEVKSVPGDWNRRGVGLSREQFDRGSELGDKFWLYVVENAEEEHFHIYRIQNPAQKANQFFYDDGWTNLSEDNASANVHPTVGTEELPHSDVRFSTDSEGSVEDGQD